MAKLTKLFVSLALMAGIGMSAESSAQAPVTMMPNPAALQAQAQSETLVRLVSLEQAVNRLTATVAAKGASAPMDPMNFCYYEDRAYGEGSNLANMHCYRAGASSAVYWQSR